MALPRTSPMRFSVMAPLLVGITLGAALRLQLAHGDTHLFLNPFFPLFPRCFS